MGMCSCYKLKDENIVFANSALINTQNNVDIQKPVTGIIANEHEIVVYNPSTATDLTIKVFTQETHLNGTTAYALLYTLTVPASTITKGTTINCQAFRLKNLFISGNCRLVVSNDSALGESAGYTATIRVTEIK